MRRTRSACCAREASGHAVADPANALMKSRRRIAFPKAQNCADSGLERCNYITDQRPEEWGSEVTLQGSNLSRPISAVGQKQTFCAAAETGRYSITSSAATSSDGGIVRPIALAALRLITNSYLVALCTGRSAGLSPLRMRST